MKVLPAFKFFRRIITLIILLSAILGSWTGFALLSSTSLKNEINTVLKEMYFNQKAFLGNIKDLSILLVQDANSRFTPIEDKDVFSSEIDGQAEDTTIGEDFNNPLGITIEPHSTLPNNSDDSKVTKFIPKEKSFDLIS